jgi:hypothetical protein
VSKEFKTKNPYKDDLENTMTREERDYLKQMLFQINLYKLSIPENTVSGLDVNSLESISTNEKIKKAIEDGSYFEMPLIRREEVSRLSLNNSLRNFWFLSDISLFRYSISLKKKFEILGSLLISFSSVL